MHQTGSPPGLYRSQSWHQDERNVVPVISRPADLRFLAQLMQFLRVTAGTRTVTAHYLHARMIEQPLLDQVGGAAWQGIDAPPGPGVDEHGRMDHAAAEREVDPPSSSARPRSSGCSPSSIRRLLVNSARAGQVDVFRSETVERAPDRGADVRRPGSSRYLLQEVQPGSPERPDRREQAPGDDHARSQRGRGHCYGPPPENPPRPTGASRASCSAARTTSHLGRRARSARRTGPAGQPDEGDQEAGHGDAGGGHHTEVEAAGERGAGQMGEELAGAARQPRRDRQRVANRECAVR